MKSARIFTVKSRLARLAFEPGGVTVDEALRRADASVQSLRESSVAIADATVAEIEARFGAVATDRAQAAFGDLYRLAGRIVDASALATGRDLDKAGQALCRLVRRCEARNAWDWVAVDLHIETLKLLHSTGAAMGEANRARLLDALERMSRKRLGDPDERACEI